MPNDIIRPITADDDAKIAAIIRANFRAFHLDQPGTAYFDPELDTLSRFYGAKPDQRAYLIAADENGTVLGGVGFAEFTAFEDCAEIQKLYLSDDTKGHGLGKRLLASAEDAARAMGYRRLYLETHSCLQVAILLYEKHGYRQIEKPSCVRHCAMDRFFMKDLD